jgi:hypothetical protein
MSTVDGNCLDDFSGPVTIDELRRARYVGLPRKSGVYVITRTSKTEPRFLLTSTGGWFKGLDPSCPPNIVSENWVEGAQTIYIGMTASEGGLKSRLCAFFDFGSGKRRGHRGGRLLWHLEDSGSLLVWWKECSAVEADSTETAAIVRFKAVYEGRRPYANMNK